MSQGNWAGQIAQYTGTLNFPSVIDVPTSVTLPAVSIPLFIRDHPIPVRKAKVTEVATISTQDPASGMEIGTNVLFYGAPEPLQLSLNGWLISPTSSIVTDSVTGVKSPMWNITTDGSWTGTSLGMTGWNYADLIFAYIEGRLSRNFGGRWVRQDPTSYVDPYGKVYSNPVIFTFDAQQVRPNRKQSFTLVLYFET